MTLDTLKIAAETARAAARTSPTIENRDAAVAASAALSAAIVAAGALPKQGRPSCRAGRLQQALSRARYR